AASAAPAAVAAAAEEAADLHGRLPLRARRRRRGRASYPLRLAAGPEVKRSLRTGMREHVRRRHPRTAVADVGGQEAAVLVLHGLELAVDVVRIDDAVAFELDDDAGLTV